jgi:hypothetical protein
MNLAHVEVVKNINNVVVNRPETPVNKGFARVFNFYKKYLKNDIRTILEPFC